MSPGPEPSTFLSGESGSVSGPRLVIGRTAADLALDLARLAAGTPRRLDRLAQRAPARDVLVAGVYRGGSQLAEALGRLRSSRHRVRYALGATGPAADPELAAHTVATALDGGKFENLNAILEAAGGARADWTLVVDDDVGLPARFLDRMVGVCEAARLDLAQPAQTMRSHAAWRVARRRRGSDLRETSFVEIGPVTAFSRRAADGLLPFPPLRYGWGLDLHWGAVARERGWRLGVVDALPVRHQTRPVAAGYAHADAIAEAQRFLAERPYVSAAEAQRTLRGHGRLA